MGVLVGLGVGVLVGVGVVVGVAVSVGPNNLPGLQALIDTTKIMMAIIERRFMTFLLNLYERINIWNNG
jgi:hypothetical protein